ncbi:DUF4383 domain-containing protein [Amycolatopsis carbonis]|uniref:DUF4383 domain-containing protein n=1 Tax=Amycolatopsis carbonis TaxID=715471 RepID=A0A9Y2ICN0_9PSEU|nr:DUF4383 domain-containing protein [Amycolatopsis sp. 2-15]WIX76816.1 DUF4383 domain-containing protein [Amycolatopsis sp. 2-15]
MSTHSPSHTAIGRSSAQLAASIVAVVFLLVGILGFIPGVATDYDQMSFAGHDSTAMLFGVFMVSTPHNIVHLLFGVVGFACARTARAARLFLLVGGVVYLVLWLYGLLIDHGSDANFVPLNNADNWLHLGLGIGMIALGLLTGREGRTVSTPTTARGPGAR